jgi:hypothetical protein
VAALVSVNDKGEEVSLHTVHGSYVHILFASVQGLSVPRLVTFAFVPSSGAYMQLAVVAAVQSDHNFLVARLRQRVQGGC